MALLRVILLLSSLILSLSSFSGVEGKKGEAAISTLFRVLDRNGDGGISWDEWKDNNMVRMEPAHFMEISAVKDLYKAFSRIDTNGDMLISFNELLATGSNLGLGKDVEQVHLALTATNTEMMVKWITDDNTTTQVQVGTKSGVYSSTFTGYTSTYDVGEAGGWHKIIHTVKVTALNPATKYYYICGDGSTNSPEYSFTTPPPTAPTVYGLVADMGTYIPLGWAVCNQIVNDHAKYNFSLIIHAGDIAYAGTGGSGEIEEIWDVWGGLVEPIASLVPYMVAIGNHEEYYNATSFMHRFRMPGYDNGGNTNLWYSIDHGNVHWIFFSTQDTYTPGSPQYQWLQKDLIAANSNRQNVAWIILVTHRPMYCSDLDELDQHQVGAAIQVALEPIMVQYGVDIYFCGHMHMYERINPVINGTVIQKGNVYNSPKAPMHIVAGTAGAFTDHKYVEPQPAWSAARNGDYGA